MNLIEQAKDLGFVAIGFSRPGKPIFFDRFSEWISSGRHGDMAWMERHLDIRRDPTRLLKGCRTVISLAYPYSREKPCTPEGFSAARYTEPSKADYHHRLKKLAKVLGRTIREKYPGARIRVCVDSAPILERSFAYSSGIGFIGKNNMLIVPGHGSFLFLGEILTTAPIPHDRSEPMKGPCGTCTRCIDACPTGALEAPYRLDASRCLSYLTIEKKGSIGLDTGQKMGGNFFGCDVCQEVCPFNGETGKRTTALPPIDAILAMTDGEFARTFGKTALARAGLNKIKDNVRNMMKEARQI
ncbi:MAG: tRNA epoxyqueuosine(34) reductase QueG [Deltaproteobacteria bacterium]|nr:tRNA epoxyqueuosine(34) reductase QueG [Deltaproteobacteria bacterium]MBW2113097.1 tRNA epoxyqueuosine(34) reductase QueG [Deltaproteobacteria bacterium]MBW2353719.1 tRNA epoxyqueuosine(34) reductase QueG [Deltaproteobacteria bacterium]